LYFDAAGLPAAGAADVKGVASNSARAHQHAIFIGYP
jgi:hypothetical protein